MAKAALAEAAMGGDPAARKIEERQAGTFAELAAEYLERHAKPNKRSRKEDERRIRSGVSADTVRRDWKIARAWLLRELSSDASLSSTSRKLTQNRW